MILEMDELLDTYYFTRVRKRQIKELSAEFPELFTLKKKVPINFQMRMADMNEKVSVSYYERKEKLSVFGSAQKIDLRRTLMLEVLQKRQEFNIFDDIKSDENESEKCWLYIDSEGNLQSGLTSNDMHELFTQGVIKPNTLIKRKMAADFSQACHLLNKFCRAKLIKRFEQGQSFMIDTGKKPSTSGFVKKAGGEIQELSASQEASKQDESEVWLKVVGKRPDIPGEGHFYGGSRPTSFSSNIDSGNYASQRISRSFANPVKLSQPSRQWDPNNLFEMASKDGVSQESEYQIRRKRSSMEAKPDNPMLPEPSGMRKRVATMSSTKKTFK